MYLQITEVNIYYIYQFFFSEYPKLPTDLQYDLFGLAKKNNFWTR